MLPATSRPRPPGQESQLAPSSPADFKREPLHSARSGEGSAGGLGEALRAKAAESGRAGKLTLRIYLPDKSTVQLAVPEECSVGETLTEVVRECRDKDRGLQGDSTCYELRLHDGDGEPDDDFPALDRTRKIRNYGRQAVNEYVLCPIPSKLQAFLSAKGGEGGAGPKLRVHISVGGQPAAGSGPPGAVPDPAGFMAEVLLKQGMTVRKVLELCAKEYRFSLFHDDFQLVISAADQQRLKSTSKVLPLDAVVADLGLEQVQLTRRVFADSPPTAGGAQRKLMHAASSSASVGVGGLLRSADAGAAGGVPVTPSSTQGGGGFSHNILTASEFKEWEVVKINTRGRRQVRLMGIDLERITNRKVEKRRLLSHQTVNAERLVTSIHRVLVKNDKPQVAFAITFVEGSPDSLITLNYEARSAYERAEIMAKLEYIMGLNNDAHRITRER